MSCSPSPRRPAAATPCGSGEAPRAARPAPSVHPQDGGDDKRADPIFRHIHGGDVEGGHRASHPPRHDDLDGGIPGLVPAVPKNGLLASIARGMLGDRHEQKYGEGPERHGGQRHDEHRRVPMALGHPAIGQPANVL